MDLRPFTFPEQTIPAFELWAPAQMRAVEAPASLASLLADGEDGFAPNIVIGHERIADGVSLSDVIAGLAARADGDAELSAQRMLRGQAGQVGVLARTFSDPRTEDRLYQVVACQFGPQLNAGTRDLFHLTGTCTVSQAETWEPLFVSAATSLRFA